MGHFTSQNPFIQLSSLECTVTVEEMSPAAKYKNFCSSLMGIGEYYQIYMYFPMKLPVHLSLIMIFLSRQTFEMKPQSMVVDTPSIPGLRPGMDLDQGYNSASINCLHHDL